MATKATPSSTIIITGANGSLGSAIVRSITERYPDKFNLILACRNPEDERSVALGEYLKSKGASFSLEKLDLSDLKLVSEFAKSVNERISDGTIPGLQGGGLLNSAAYMTHVKDSKTNDGFDEMYQVIALAPALLIRSLLPSLESKDENAEGALVVSAGSAAHPTGVVDYFQKRKDITQKFGPEGKVVRTSIVETMNRYGSSKLLLIMLSYAFQRKVYAVCTFLHFRTKIMLTIPRQTLKPS
jgi:NAD(P)-dependent dehydrogenase (short-subunit alcohol dehydrogenase family)